MIVTTLVLLGPVLLMPAPLEGAVRRRDADLHRLRPAGEHHDLLPRLVLIIPLIVTGLAIDLLQHAAQAADGRLSLGGIRAIGPAGGAVLWMSYYGVLALDKGIGWEPTLWVGALIVGTMTGFGVAFLVAPPSYGPRLVEAD